MSVEPPVLLRFGVFELDLEAGQLRKEGRLVHLKPQPFKLLCLLTSRTGKLVTREEIQSALWKDETFVDFEQGVNFAIRQVREALSDHAEHSVYVQTVPKRGYRFLAPVTTVSTPPSTDQTIADPLLDKALWANIAELRLAEERREKRQRVWAIAIVVVAVVLVIVFLLRSA